MSCFRGSEEDCTLIKGFETICLAGYTGMGSLYNATMMQSGLLLVMPFLSLNHWKFESDSSTRDGNCIRLFLCPSYLYLFNLTKY